MLYRTKNILSRECHCDNVVSSKATKTSTSGQQFCSRVSGLHTFGRNKTTTTSLLNHAPQSVRLDLANTKLRIVADRPLLSCDLDVSIQLLGWILLINYFDTRHATVFDLFDCSSIRLCTSQFQNRPSPPLGNPRPFDSR